MLLQRGGFFGQGGQIDLHVGIIDNAAASVPEVSPAPITFSIRR
jgi:hypothetical protein